MEIPHTLGQDYAAAWSTLSPQAVLDFFVEDEVSPQGRPQHPMLQTFSGCHGTLRKGIGFEIELIMKDFTKLAMTCLSFDTAPKRAILRWTMKGRRQDGTPHQSKGWDEWETTADGKITYAQMRLIAQT